MNTRNCSACLVLMILLTLVSPVFADAGPKPDIQVHAFNLPTGTVYIDLLVETPPDLLEPRESNRVYDPELIRSLSSAEAQGWFPVLASGRALTFGELQCPVENGQYTAEFSYHVPDRFRIIVAAEGREPVISNVIERKAFASFVEFNYADATAHEVNIIWQALAQLPVTLSITLIAEGLVLLLFGFQFRANMKVFLWVNIASQIFLMLAVGYGMFLLGLLGAIFFGICAEAGIFTLETVLFYKLLSGQSKGRRIAYALTANTVSLVAGGILMVLLQGPQGI